MKRCPGTRPLCGPVSSSHVRSSTLSEWQTRVFFRPFPSLTLSKRLRYTNPDLQSHVCLIQLEPNPCSSYSKPIPQPALVLQTPNAAFNKNSSTFKNDMRMETSHPLFEPRRRQRPILWRTHHPSEDWWVVDARHAESVD